MLHTHARTQTHTHTRTHTHTQTHTNTHTHTNTREALITQHGSFEAILHLFVCLSCVQMEQ